MKQLAYWSHQNPWKARMIIAACHLMILVMAIYMGIQTYIMDIVISKLSMTTMAVIFAGAYILYPIRQAKGGLFKYSFRRRVRHDVILLASSAWIMAGSVNQFSNNPIEPLIRDISITLMVANEMHHTGKRADKLEMKEMVNRIKVFRKSIKQNLAEAKEINREQPQTSRAVLVVITLLLALGVFFLLGYLACSLACSGNVALAWLVYLGGTLGIILLTMAAIRSIFQKRKNQQPAAVPVV